MARVGSARFLDGPRRKRRTLNLIVTVGIGCLSCTLIIELMVRPALCFWACFSGIKPVLTPNHTIPYQTFIHGSTRGLTEEFAVARSPSPMKFANCIIFMFEHEVGNPVSRLRQRHSTDVQLAEANPSVIYTTLYVGEIFIYAKIHHHRRASKVVGDSIFRSFPGVELSCVEH